MYSYKIICERYEKVRQENKKLYYENCKLNNKIKHKDKPKKTGQNAPSTIFNRNSIIPLFQAFVK